MDSEMQAFTEIWLTAIASTIFCHQIAGRIPSGAARLISLLPIIYLFTTLPLRLSSFHIGGATVALLVWIGNFKLLLFAFNEGPLSTTPPLSLLHFISIALLPIRPKQSLSNDTMDPPIPSLLKCALLGVLLITLCEYRELYVHSYYLLLLLYCCYIYLILELGYAVPAALVLAVLGLELQPHFNEPYFATSLQDFWGRRWNLIIASILRPAVYRPVRRISAGILGRRWAIPLSVLATFLVSGLMHEVIKYYMTRASPTWELTCFFALQGFLVVVEVELKTAALNRGWRLHRAVSVALTLGIVVLSIRWLYLPISIRQGIDLKAINECSVFVRYFRDLMHSFL